MQLLRCHRICTYPDDVQEATTILFQALPNRGHAKRFLREIKQQVVHLFLSSDRYRGGGVTSDPSLIPMVQTYFHHLSHFNSAIRANFAQAQLDCSPLCDFKLITAYRKNRNLKDSLVHAALERNLTDKELLHYLPFIFNKASGTGLPVSLKLGSSSSNLIYAIRCEHCRKIYIDETRRTLEMRIKEHINNINRDNTEKSLYTHFRQVSI